ncbi:MAG TPA: enoyl-CoA hydratase-related protein [Caulobacteraceae bacterium]|nr:enoyl-CoA hydratase-related protein [Caulobacteraceae bacterium]
MPNPIADPFVEVPNTDATSELVTIEATPEGAVTVSLNRPEKKNAFDAELIGALREAFETLRDQENVRVVFVRGEGGTFSAGADLEWMRDAIDRTEADNRDDAMQMAIMLKHLHDVPALTVALVEGGAFGGGAGLAAACDMAIAVKGARFSFSEVKLGLIAATISPYVVAAIGPRRARRLFASGEVFDAEAAARFGLVDEVADDAAALEAAKVRISNSQMLCAPGAVEESKRLVTEVAGREIDHGLMVHTAKRIAAQRVSEEGQAGVRAFLDGKKAPWAE